MYERVETVLNSLGFPQDYLKAFQENDMDDESLVSCLESDMDMLKVLADIIPSLGRRVKFVNNFKKQLNDNGATEETNPIQPSASGGSSIDVASPIPHIVNGIVKVQTLKSRPQERTCIPSSPPSQSGTTSIQIMEFEQASGGSKTRKVILFETEFSKVIEKSSPGRPVAVLAIAGKANKGKSLFLSYVLHYLKAQQQGNSDWMGWNDTTTRPLDGFRWANGYEVVTKGIWIWSEPITCKNSRGQEFDVLLMDTQGVFDEKTGHREWNILAGLGLLTSSVMVLNASNDVQEDTLESLQNFLSFGLLALDRDDSSVSHAPFQNLVFLVRDWENHQEFPFGNEGGRRFIKRKLEEKPDHDDFHRRLRRQMKSCFEDIDCFLFPYPGRSARENDFTGSVVNAPPEFREFAKQMQLCIEQLVNPEKFPFKTLNGNVLTAPDVLNMFKSYVEIFNSDALPSSNDLYNAAAHSCNAVIIKKCVNAFVKTLGVSLSSVPFLNDKELSQAQEAAEGEAVSMFRKSRKMGDAEALSAAKEELSTKMVEEFANFQAQNKIKFDEARRQLEAKVREILATYDAEMDSKITDEVFDQSVVTATHNEQVSNAQKKFQDLQCKPELEPEGLSLLEKHLQSPEKWQQRVKVNCEKLESSIHTFITQAERDYERALDPSKFKDEAEMAKIVSDSRNKAFGALQEITSKLSESKMNFYNRDLNSRLNSIELEAREEVQQNQETLQDRLESTIANAAEEYKKSMAERLSSLNEASEKQKMSVLSSVFSYFSRSPNRPKEGLTVDEMPALSPKDLQTLHNEFEDKAVETLSRFIQINSKRFKDQTQVEQKSREKLNDLTSQSFANFQRLAEHKRENARAQAMKDVVKAEQDFGNELKKLLNNAKNDKLFQVEATLLKSQARTGFESSLDPSFIGKQSVQEIMSNWDSKVEQLLTHYKLLAKKQHEQRVENAKVQAVTNVTTFEQEFRAGMKKLIDSTRDDSVFQLEASDLKSRLRTQLENSMDESLIGKETIREHLSQWDSKVEKLLKQYQGLFALKKKEDEIELKSASAKAQVFYSNQMKTVFETKTWYPPAEFSKINNQVLEDTLSKLQKEDKISTHNATLLRKSLQGLHQKFEEENESRVPKGSHAIGIDLGTTYSCVGVYVNGNVEIIQENEKFTIPSCVYFDEGNNRVVGEAAQDGAFRSPENFIFDAKRLIGRTWNEPVVQEDMKHWNFNVVDVGGQPKIKCRGGTLRPEEISAEVLAHLKAMAEKHLGQKVTHAVVTVPAYFNDGQRQATKDAAEIAGLTATILKEPVAAAIAYRLERTGDSLGRKNILVFDLGGGTFDIAILTIYNWNLDVKTISGDMHLGGEDFDNLMVKHVLENVKAKTGRDLVRDKASSNPEVRKKANDFIRRLKMECERKKRALSTAKLVRIVVEQADWTIDEKMTQQEFEKLVNPSLLKCMEIVEKALKAAKMSKSDIHDVVLVGGSTKIPKVQELLKEYFKGVQLRHSVNPDQAVAYGAAMQAAMKAGSSTQGEGIRNKLSVQDVTPFSIGIRNSEGKLVIQVPKGSHIPFSYKHRWCTAADYQTGASFIIFEGEDTVATNNRQLGKFNLKLPSMKQGEAKMESTTLVDDEGIVRVRAVCLIDGAENDIVIDTFNGRMSRSEIENSRKATEERRG